MEKSFRFFIAKEKDQPYYEFAKDLAVSLDRPISLVKDFLQKKKFDYKLPRYEFERYLKEEKYGKTNSSRLFW